MNKSLSKPDCTLPGQTIVKYNSGTGQGQSEKSRTVPDVPGQLGTMLVIISCMCVCLCACMHARVYERNG